MEAVAEPCEVSGDLFQTHRLVASSSVDRRGTVAKVRLHSATGPRLPWRTPSLLLPPLPQPLPPRSRRRCSCTASRSPPHCPGGTGVPGQKIQKLGKREGAYGIATLGHRRDQEWQGSAREAGEAGPERAGQEPGWLASRPGVRVSPSRPAFPRRPPHAGSEPRRAPPAMSPDWRWPVSTGQVREVVPVEKGQPWRGSLGSS